MIIISSIREKMSKRGKSEVENVIRVTTTSPSLGLNQRSNKKLKCMPNLFNRNYKKVQSPPPPQKRI